ncbi:MAG: hypothetical protein HGA67_04370 [Candidatus Yonathbacteria bacterium]|nr:hypothetical protein [Candidatus Yonathbacteria bacterium]
MQLIISDYLRYAFMNDSLKHTAYVATTIALAISFVYPAIEPVIAHAASANDSVTVTQAVTAGIAITSPSDITMTALTTSQNTAVGSAAWTVTTNNQAGYKLELHASNDPALVQVSPAESFTDYSEGTPGTPETWSVSSAYEFGFSARGTDVSAGTWGTDTDCLNTADVPSATLKWRGFDGTNNIQVATAATETTTSGTASTMCVATQQAGVFAPSGSYTATITATATTL